MTEPTLLVRDLDVVRHGWRVERPAHPLRLRLAAALRAWADRLDPSPLRTRPSLPARPHLRGIVTPA